MNEEIDSIIEGLVNGKDEWSRDWSEGHPHQRRHASSTVVDPDWAKSAIGRTIQLHISDQATKFEELRDAFANFTNTIVKINWQGILSAFEPVYDSIREFGRQRNRALLARHRRRRGR